MSETCFPFSLDGGVHQRTDAARGIYGARSAVGLQVSKCSRTPLATSIVIRLALFVKKYLPKKELNTQS